MSLTTFRTDLFTVFIYSSIFHGLKLELKITKASE